MRLSETTELYLSDVARRCTPATVKKYRENLDELLDALGNSRPVESITSEDCLSHLMKWSTSAPKTQGSHWTTLNQLFKFARIFGFVEQNPMDRVKYPKIPAPEDRGVKTISRQDVQKMMQSCITWSEKLCVFTLAYMGVRRAAANNLRWKDVDLELGYMTFKEKGHKTIRKPIPLPLLELLKSYRASLSEGEWPSPAGASSGSLVNFGKTKTEKSTRQDSDSSSSPSLSDAYVIPSEHLASLTNRNARFIWRTVKKVGARAGVDVHCHAFRSAFAVFYLESNEGHLEGLQSLMGHRNIATTQGYLRRLDKEKAMEKVRTLDWGVSLTTAGDNRGTDRPAIPLGSPAAASEGVSLTPGGARSNSLADSKELAHPPGVSEDVSLTDDKSENGSAKQGVELFSHRTIDDSERHNSDQERRSNYMTNRRLRGKDSNLDSTTVKHSSSSQGVSKRERQKCHVSKPRSKRTT